MKLNIGARRMTTAYLIYIPSIARKLLEIVPGDKVTPEIREEDGEFCLILKKQN